MPTRTAVAAVLLAAAAPAADPGFTPLFNGRDLSGWSLPPQGQLAVAETRDAGGKVVALVGTPKQGGDPVTLWQVKDGCLVGGGPMTHLYADPEVGDFHLKAVVKINDKGNSGIFFRAGYTPGIPTGYEAQVNATHGDPVKTGSLYPNGMKGFGLDRYGDTFLVKGVAPVEPDEFYTHEVICRGAHIRIVVDGKTTVDWTDPEHRFKKGRFAVQAHDPGSVMTFKAIEYKPLDK